jgi:hypothetical protein
VVLDKVLQKPNLFGREMDYTNVPIILNLVPLTKEKMNKIAWRFPYDMEYYYRKPCKEMENY